MASKRACSVSLLFRFVLLTITHPRRRCGRLSLCSGNDQERERGITILAKNTAIRHKDIKINIVDTPGHADFGGEVERVLNMVDGVLLVVDAAEGPKPQTRFVLKQAIKMGHKVLVVLNKIDKPQAEPDMVVDKTFDLFCELGASDEQTDFGIVYTSALRRQSGLEVDAVGEGMDPLLDAILDLPKPVASVDEPLQLQISNVGADQYLGRLMVGRIRSGTLRRGQAVGVCNGPGSPVAANKVGEVFVYDGMGRAAVEQASAGEIVVVSGVSQFNIGDTVVDPNDPMPLTPIEVEQPTMSITMSVNRSPFKGKCKETKFLTSTHIRDRLAKELETNVALRVVDDGDDQIQIYGRGLLHLTVLIESMRREGFEIMVGPPKVLFKEDENGKKTEPFEQVDIELPEEHSGGVIEMLQLRKATLLDMGAPNSDGMQTLQYELPTRGMVGMKSKMMTATRGLAVMTSTFAGYKPYAGDFGGRTKGNLLSTETGTANNYGLDKSQSRGQLFAKHNDEVFKDQIIGIHSSAPDLAVNICRKKALTNFRASGKEDAYNLAPPISLTLEEAVEYVTDGEFVEITPEAVRMGKIKEAFVPGKKK